MSRSGNGQQDESETDLFQLNACLWLELGVDRGTHDETRVIHQAV